MLLLRRLGCSDLEPRTIGGAGKDRGIFHLRHVAAVATAVVLCSLELALTFYTIATIENVFPLRILEQRQDLIELSQRTAAMADRARLARSVKSSEAIGDVLRQAEGISTRLDEIRETYGPDTPVGAASVHATLDPALIDIKTWLQAGSGKLSASSDSVLSLVERRAIGVNLSMSELVAQADALSFQALHRQAEQLSDRRYILIVIAVVTLISMAFLVSYVVLRKRLENRLIEAIQRADAANLAKSDFLAVMSHELRTPLNAVIGFSQLIKDEMFGPIGQRLYADYAQDINNSACHLLGLINDVLDLSTAESGHRDLTLESTCLSQPVRDLQRTFEDMAAEKNHTLTLNLDNDLTVRVDRRAMRQILLNLTTNAMKYTKPGGRIEISVGPGGTGEAQLVVRDNGVGIADSDIANVFEPFTRVADSRTAGVGGTGIGLALVKKLVKLHDGRVEMTSQPAVGTTVTVTLPLVK